MRNPLLLLVCLAWAGLCQAQQAWVPQWEQSLPFAPTHVGIGHNNGWAYAANDKQLCALATDSGKLRWQLTWAEVLPKAQAIQSVWPLWEAGILLVADTRPNTPLQAAVEAATGKVLWSTYRFPLISQANGLFLPGANLLLVGTPEGLVAIDAKTGALLWQSMGFRGAPCLALQPAARAGTLVIANYAPLRWQAGGFRNQLVCIDINTGNILWEQPYKGFLERKLTGQGTTGRLVEQDSSIVLELNGRQRFGLATGKPLLTAAFESTLATAAPRTAGTLLATGLYSAVAPPQTDPAGNLYWLDFSSRQRQYIRKVRQSNGTAVWASPEIKQAGCAPRLWVTGNRVVVQFGGMVERQALVQYRQADGSEVETTLADLVPLGPHRVLALDADSGRLQWVLEMLPGGLVDTRVYGDSLLVCTPGQLSCHLLADGRQVWKLSLKEAEIGKAKALWLSAAGKPVVAGADGVAAVTYGPAGPTWLAKRIKGLGLPKQAAAPYCILPAANGHAGAYDADSNQLWLNKAAQATEWIVSPNSDVVYGIGKGQILKLVLPKKP